MAKLEVRCPVCAKWDNIEILDDATKNVKKGLLAVNISPGMICDHSFIAYIDKNLIVRDCFIADFKIEASEAEIGPKEGDKALPETESIKFDLIKLNVPEKLMAMIFKAIFLGKKVILISEDQFLYNHVINFFSYALKDLFNIDLNIMSEASYKKIKNDYDNYLVFKKSNVLHDKNKIVDSKKLNIEKSITQKFFAEYDLTTGLIILRNEIQKAFEYSKTLAEFITGDQKKIFTPKILINHITEMQGERIQKNYLKFLLEIAKYYFKAEIPKNGGVSNFLGTL